MLSHTASGAGRARRDGSLGDSLGEEEKEEERRATEARWLIIAPLLTRGFLGQI